MEGFVLKKKHKLFAEKTLKHLSIGANVDGLQFGLSPATIKIYFTHYERNTEKDFIYLNIESKWCLYSSEPDHYPTSEEEITDITERG